MKIKLLKFKSVKSTNDIALKLIKKKSKTPTIILTEKQTKGRGTMGKKWISQKGNLFFTIFFALDKKNIDFKKFAVLNAYLLKNILSKRFSNKLKLNGQTIYCLKKENLWNFARDRNKCWTKISDCWNRY